MSISGIDRAIRFVIDCMISLVMLKVSPKIDEIMSVVRASIAACASCLKDIIIAKTKGSIN
jgi:hypothetical protein